MINGLLDAAFAGMTGGRKFLAERATYWLRIRKPLSEPLLFSLRGEIVVFCQQRSSCWSPPGANRSVKPGQPKCWGSDMRTPATWPLHTARRAPPTETRPATTPPETILASPPPEAPSDAPPPLGPTKSLQREIRSRGDRPLRPNRRSTRLPLIAQPVGALTPQPALFFIPQSALAGSNSCGVL
jgi:hypothetical protein